jgi:hypothetical protein
MERHTAAAANEHRHNLDPDVSLSSVLDETEYLDTTVHCPNCSCGEKRAAPAVRETVTRIGKRVIRKTFVGPWQI